VRFPGIALADVTGDSAFTDALCAAVVGQVLPGLPGVTEADLRCTVDLREGSVIADVNVDLPPETTAEQAAQAGDTVQSSFASALASSPTLANLNATDISVSIEQVCKSTYASGMIRMLQHQQQHLYCSFVPVVQLRHFAQKVQRRTPAHA
jgi:hypothetical protein